MILLPAHVSGYTPRSDRAEGDAVGTWRDRECKGCGETFAPTSKTQQYCPTCTTQCRVSGCQMKVRARGYCANHLRQTHPVPNIPMRKDGLCGVADCGRRAFAKGHCQFHYDRVRLYAGAGDAAPKARKQRGIPCEVDGCARPAVGDGLCNRHFARRRKTGESGPAELLRRAQGEGSITETGYKRLAIDGVYWFEHRYVMEQILGRALRDGENVHHKNGDRLDNSPENLEVWISQQPPGQRVADLVEYALQILKRYPNELADEGYRLLPLESQEATDCLSLDDFALGALSAC